MATDATAHYDVCVVGGLGHVGLPLSMALADRGLKVCAFDISQTALDTVRGGKLPFIEYDAEPVLKRVLEAGTLVCTDKEECISDSDTVVMITGTPVDGHLSPEFETLLNVFRSYESRLRNGQLIILRSTVYPGTTQRLYEFLREGGRNIEVAFCPERIAEGHAMHELTALPHIVSGTTPSAVARARKIFEILNPEIVVLEPLEAEMAKLFTNVYRYVKFAIANQFLTIANESGLDYYRIHHAIKHKYPRAADLPAPGFAAGPCLYKDTVQLSAFTNHNFFLGQASLLVNEGLPHYIVSKLAGKHDLRHKTVGILGMAFKADVDDPRDSLAYKLRKILAMEAREVFCSDVHIKEPGFLPTEELIRRSDIVIVGAPHKEYRSLHIENRLVVDVWNIFGKGCRI
jgi:UDP-N-acetyl-D-mannosaminuronic acid dehydrogenase